MTAYPGQTQTTLGQLCPITQSRSVVIQPGIEPGSVVTPLALRCSALDRSAIPLGGAVVGSVNNLAYRLTVSYNVASIAEHQRTVPAEYEGSQITH